MKKQQAKYAYLQKLFCRIALWTGLPLGERVRPDLRETTELKK
jgi:hypothetical protein